MPVDEAYNGFAKSIAEQFSERARGADNGSKRIVDRYPWDHVLTGFLMPVREDHDSEEAVELEANSDGDLPVDHAYEVTNIGLEWLVPAKATESESLEIKFEYSIYVPRLPTQKEQQEAYRGYKATQRGPQMPLVPVWTREDMPVISHTIPFAELRSDGRCSRSLTGDVLAGLQKLDLSGFRSVQTPSISPDALDASPDQYSAALKRYTGGRSGVVWNPVLDIRLLATPSQPDMYRVSVRLVNRSVRTVAWHDANLYRVALEVKVDSSKWAPMTFRELPSSYRYNRDLPAQGVNCGVVIESVERTKVLRTVTVPEKAVQRLEPRRIDKADPTFAVLMSDPIPVLNNILDDMVRFDREDWEQAIRSPRLTASERADAAEDRKHFREDEVKRFKRGIEVLSNPRYSLVKEAFLMMNEAMADLGKRQDRGAWRLFQIVFIVSQLGGLAAREYPELDEPGDDRVEILWFAAGGGKTEAFLGLVVWQAFFDRLRGKQYGVTALIRYPLRLLTFQQLKRLSQVLACADRVRAGKKLPGQRFSLGYLVGAGGTPNRISEEEHRAFSRGPVPSKYQKVFTCPFCGAPIELKYNQALHLIEHWCTNSTCEGGPDRLPVYIVDDDIFRYLPTVVVSTVDKLSQFGQQQRFSNILGRFTMICHAHGASFLDANSHVCPACADPSNPTSCSGYKVVYGGFRDPGPALLVQDELHLLSEELGTFDAHYETAVMQASKSLGFKPWKIIAATATIERFWDHSENLYLRNAVQFPAPGPTALRTFYYQPNDASTGRVFVGLVGVGRKHTPAVSRALTILYQIIQSARELAETDLASAVSKFKTGPLPLAEFRDLIFNYELVLTYVLTRKGSDQVAEAVETRVKQDLNYDCPNHGPLKVQMFNGGVDQSELIRAMEEIENASSKDEPQQRTRGLIATNVISHGVDVNRFNLIVFAGFTRLVAEYIQASARVGRKFPGLSVFVATPQSERDRSVLERFEKFHEYVDRLVDPSAINRWSEDALERTVPGVLAGYLMAVAAHSLGTRIVKVTDVKRAHSKVGSDALELERIVAWMEDAFGVSHARNSSSYGDRLRAVVSNRYSTLIGNESRADSELISQRLMAMKSLRDTDTPARVQAESQADGKLIRGFAR